ncbi:MAG: hypothetical protein ACJA1C_001048 [Crocinitomicaceae bacterium]|jgi:hypothetical protein
MCSIKSLIGYLGFMKVNRIEHPNTGLLESTNKEIDVRNGRWIDWNNTSHPINYIQPLSENREGYIVVNLTFLKCSHYL